MIHSLKYEGYTTLGCKVIGIRKSEIVAKLNSFVSHWDFFPTGDYFYAGP